MGTGWSQGLSARSDNTLFETYGTTVWFDGTDLFAFWPPERIAGAGEDQLRALKVGYRAKSLVRITQAFVNGEVDELALTMDRDATRKELLRLYGIGPQSVWYILFGVFHHYDAFDVLSPWEQRIYSRLLFNEGAVPADRVLAEVKRRWGRWRMLASHYVFEDLFWRHKQKPIPWLRDLIRL